MKGIDSKCVWTFVWTSLLLWTSTGLYRIDS